MTKTVALFFCFFSASFMYAQEFQFAVIHDNDGSANVRKTPEIKDNSIEKLNNGAIVYHFGSENNWTSIYYQKNGKELEGYVYNDRLKRIAKYTKIKKKSDAENNLILSGKGITVSITTKKFDKSQHTFTYGNKVIKEIDNKQPYGSDGDMPKTEYQSIKVEFGDTVLLLPKEALQNLFEPNLDYTEVNYDEENDILYIQSLNSDGAGGYSVLWVIEHKKYKQRMEATPF